MKKFLLIIVLVILLFNEFNAQWVNISPIDENGSPFTQYLSEICILPSSSIIVGGHGGLLLKSDNGGNTWKKLSPPDSGIITYLSFINDQFGIVSTENDIYKTTNGGSTWQAFGRDVSSNSFTIAFNELEFLTAYNYFYALGHSAAYGTYICISTNGGATWPITGPVGQSYIPRDLYILDINKVIISTEGFLNDYYLHETSDQGKNWTLLSKQSGIAENISSLNFINYSLGWCLVSRYISYYERHHTIKNTTDGGVTWNTNKVADYPLSSINFIDAQNGWVCGVNGTLLHTSNGGERWDSIKISNNNLSRIKFTDSKTGYVIGSQGSIYKTTTGGLLSLNHSIDETPNSFNLYQNYPNPFNPTTTINYSIHEDQLIELKVYDVMGNEVADLVNEYKPAGNYSVTFNASNLASGVYFYRIKAGSNILTKKLTLIK